MTEQEATNYRGRCIGIPAATTEEIRKRAEDDERIHATICPICDKCYGYHDDEDMRICFPALVAMVNQK